MGNRCRGASDPPAARHGLPDAAVDARAAEDRRPQARDDEEALALGGAELFTLVGLKADLGALVLGVIIAHHSKAEEMAKTMLGFKKPVTFIMIKT